MGGIENKLVKFRFALFLLSTGNTLESWTSFCSTVPLWYFYISQWKAKLPQWMCIFLPFPSKKENPHFMVSKELPHSLFSVLLFWVQVSESVPQACQVLLWRSITRVLYWRALLRKQFWDRDLFPVCVLFWYFCRVVQVVETLFKAKYHMRRVCEVTHFSFLGFFLLLTVERLHTVVLQLTCVCVGLYGDMNGDQAGH